MAEMNSLVGHQKGCPYDEIALPKNGLSEEHEVLEEIKENTICCDRRCCVWQDLASWFGYTLPELNADEFRSAFTDVAHGGSGLYEKFIVLGHKTLETFGEMYIANQFDPTEIPQDLLDNSIVPLELCRSVWTLKRVERLVSPECILMFAKSYLSAAQSLPTEMSCVKYVKACVGFSSHFLGQDAKKEEEEEELKRLEWLPCLVEHMMRVHQLSVEDHEEDNLMLQDIQEYFGYRYKTLIPRVKELLTNCVVTYDQPNGEQLLRYYAMKYFSSLSDQRGIKVRLRESWVKVQVEQLINSPALRLFSSCWLSLSPYFALHNAMIHLPNSSEYQRLCGLLIATCFNLSNEENSRIWMLTLIHRLRQIQLMIQLNGHEDDVLHRDDSAECVVTPREVSLSDVPPSRADDQKKCQSHEIKQKMVDHEHVKECGEDVQKDPRLHEGVKAKIPVEHKSLFQKLQGIVQQCFFTPSRPYSRPIFMVANEKGNGPLELKPLCSIPALHSVPKDSHPCQNIVWEDEEEEAPQSANQNPPYSNNTRRQHSTPPLEVDPQHTKRNDRLTVFGRTKRCSSSHQESLTEAGKNKRAPRSLFQGCKEHLWSQTSYDKDGVKLWRPPGAILMRKHRQCSSNPRTATSPPLKNPAHFNSSPACSLQNPSLDENKFYDKTPTKTNIHITATETQHSSDAVQLNVRYVMPNNAQHVESSPPPPLDIALYSSRRGEKTSPHELLRAVIGGPPNGKHSQNVSELPCYSFTDDKGQDCIRLNLIASGGHGSKRIDFSPNGRQLHVDQPCTFSSSGAYSSSPRESSLEEKETRFSCALSTDTTRTTYGDTDDEGEARDVDDSVTVASRFSSLDYETAFTSPNHSYSSCSKTNRRSFACEKCCTCHKGCSLYSSESTESLITCCHTKKSPRPHTLKKRPSFSSDLSTSRRCLCFHSPTPHSSETSHSRSRCARCSCHPGSTQATRSCDEGYTSSFPDSPWSQKFLVVEPGSGAENLPKSSLSSSSSSYIASSGMKTLNRDELHHTVRVVESKKMLTSPQASSTCHASTRVRRSSGTKPLASRIPGKEATGATLNHEKTCVSPKTEGFPVKPLTKQNHVLTMRDSFMRTPSVSCKSRLGTPSASNGLQLSPSLPRDHPREKSFEHFRLESFPSRTSSTLLSHGDRGSHSSTNHTSKRPSTTTTSLDERLSNPSVSGHGRSSSTLETSAVTTTKDTSWTSSYDTAVETVSYVTSSSRDSSSSTTSSSTTSSSTTSSETESSETSYETTYEASSDTTYASSYETARGEDSWTDAKASSSATSLESETNRLTTSLSSILKRFSQSTSLASSTLSQSTSYGTSELTSSGPLFFHSAHGSQRYLRDPSTMTSSARLTSSSHLYSSKDRRSSRDCASSRTSSVRSSTGKSSETSKTLPYDTSTTWSSSYGTSCVSACGRQSSLTTSRDSSFLTSMSRSGQTSSNTTSHPSSRTSKRTTTHTPGDEKTSNDTLASPAKEREQGDVLETSLPHSRRRQHTHSPTPRGLTKQHTRLSSFPRIPRASGGGSSSCATHLFDQSHSKTPHTPSPLPLNNFLETDVYRPQELNLQKSWFYSPRDEEKHNTRRMERPGFPAMDPYDTVPLATRRTVSLLNGGSLASSSRLDPNRTKPYHFKHVHETEPYHIKRPNFPFQNPTTLVNGRIQKPLSETPALTGLRATRHLFPPVILTR